MEQPVYRPATADDNRFIAEMLEMSSDGVALIEWSEAAQEAGDRTPLDIGAELYTADTGDYSHRNCRVAQVAGERAGLLLSFPMRTRDTEEPAPAPPFDGSDVFAPYKYLEAPDTWYVCGVAVRPRYRGRGIGTGLMELAREQALEHGYAQLSLVVFEENTAAVRLYRRLGYEIAKRAPIVPHPLIRCEGDALLMVAPAHR
ncbi:MAG: GNAT family N-acetyltransferase [Gammaproteobacteria bacterium]|jgi:ribosomal protein S18 acetylase RimI-like enzyme